MKVLHLTCNDARTGGANALHRLHVSLLAAGVDSRVILGADEDKSPSERHIPRSFAWRIADKPFRIIAEHTGLHGVVRPSFRLWCRAIDAFNPDVVHIHWTYSGGTPPLVSLRSLAAAYPIVWTFHDMWAFTGGCTISKGCERWLSGCGSCPLLATGEGSSAMMPMPWDLTAVQWKIKRWAFRGIPVTVVAPSPWMADLVLRSPIMSGAMVECVPNPLDTAVFAPRDRRAVRVRLGLPLSAKVVFYIGKPEPGSVFSYEGRVPLLLETLRLVRVDDPDLARNMQLLIVGGMGEELIRSSGYQGVAIGSLNDESEMADCLSAADVMINTTQYDNLPGVVQEAMSSGLAVVASRVGGLPNMIDNGVSGILVDHTSPRAFADAVQMVLTDTDLRNRLGSQARVVAIERYDFGRVAADMISAYERSRETRADIA